MESSPQTLDQRSYRFSLKLIQLIDTLPTDIISRTISHQLIRSGTSIGANLVESKASSSRLEFKKFQEISLKSANETKYWLQLLKDTQKSQTRDIDLLLGEVTELANMIAAGVIKLKSRKL